MTTTRCADVVSVPVMVDAGVDRVEKQRIRAASSIPDTDAARAVSWARIAELYRREARWWGVLANWAYSPASGALPYVFGYAAIKAQGRARRAAETYDELVASARRRAALDGVGVVA